MTSQDRRDRLADGRPVENAAAIRRRRREEASIMREELAIELFAQGKTVAEIADAMQERYGVRVRANLPAMIRRGLYRRVKGNERNVEAAKEMLLEQYQQLLQVYMPRALGLAAADADGNRPPPDTRAAELALKVLDKVGVATGAITPPRSGDINLGIVIGSPDDAAEQRRRVMDSLEVERRKQEEIRNALAGTPATLEGEIVDDGKIMPPIPAAPTQER